MKIKIKDLLLFGLLIVLIIITAGPSKKRMTKDFNELDSAFVAHNEIVLKKLGEIALKRDSTQIVYMEKIKYIKQQTDEINKIISNIDNMQSNSIADSITAFYATNPF